MPILLPARQKLGHWAAPRALGSPSKLGPLLTAAAGEAKMAALGQVNLTSSQQDQLATLPNLQVQFPKPQRKFFPF